MEASTAAAGTVQELNTLVQNTTPDLKDLLEDGIYMLFLLRSGTAPHKAEEFNKRVDQFLSQFERHAQNFGKSHQAVQESKYAFCALMDEIILASNFRIRDEWERNPLQLRLFGEHLAGEGFFQRLEDLRLDPKKNIEILEVYYTCLLLGFQGKYLLEGMEKLNYLIARIGQEIGSIRGGKTPFSPHWKPVFRFQEFVRHELPLWVFFSLLALVALIVFLIFSYMLGSRVNAVSQVWDNAPTQVSFAASPDSRMV